MAILDGHVSSKTVAKKRNQGASIMATVLTVDDFAIVPITSMERFVKIKMLALTRDS